MSERDSDLPELTFVDAKVRGFPVNAMIDSGASRNFVSAIKKEALRPLRPCILRLPPLLVRREGISVKMRYSLRKKLKDYTMLGLSRFASPLGEHKWSSLEIERRKGW